MGGWGAIKATPKEWRRPGPSSLRKNYTQERNFPEDDGKRIRKLEGRQDTEAWKETHQTNPKDTAGTWVQSKPAIEGQTEWDTITEAGTQCRVQSERQRLAGRRIWETSRCTALCANKGGGKGDIFYGFLACVCTYDSLVSPN